jgi:CheY-like chemotaxis protein
LILTAKDLTSDDLKRLSANHVQQLVQKGDVDRENLLAKVRMMVGVGLDTKALQPALHLSQGPTRSPGLATILIIEDNLDNMTTIKAVLQDRYRILEATDGEAGLRAAGEARPDLILLDIALPNIDGLTVVRRLKDNSALAFIPVIAMTARVMKGDREEVLKAGCDDYISKPIDPEDCRKKIDGWINR